MGLRYRKSFKAGPVRVNLSKSGVGWSAGTKGARVTKKASGGYRTSVGANGLYSTNDFGGSRASRKDNAKKKSGCLPWLGGLFALFAFFGLLGSCSPEEPEANMPEEAPPIVEVQDQVQSNVLEEEPEEKEVIEFDPIFVDPATGEHTTGKEETQTPSSDVESDADSSFIVEQEAVPQEQIVYITNTGSKYHRDGCRHLSESKIEIELATAESRGYTACGTCH